MIFLIEGKFWNVRGSRLLPAIQFFRVLRTVGLALAAAGAALLAAQVALPAAIISIASYVAVEGSGATAISQAAIESLGTNRTREASLTTPACLYLCLWINSEVGPFNSEA